MALYHLVEKFKLSFEAQNLYFVNELFVHSKDSLDQSLCDFRQHFGDSKLLLDFTIPDWLTKKSIPETNGMYYSFFTWCYNFW